MRALFNVGLCTESDHRCIFIASVSGGEAKTALRFISIVDGLRKECPTSEDLVAAYIRVDLPTMKRLAALELEAQEQPVSRFATQCLQWCQTRHIKYAGFNIACEVGCDNRSAEPEQQFMEKRFALGDIFVRVWTTHASLESARKLKKQARGGDCERAAREIRSREIRSTLRSGSTEGAAAAATEM